MISISDMPPEIVEKFTPDETPETISKMKLISKQFNSVFSADRYFRPYLARPEVEYVCEMRSECKGEGVKEVVEKISSQEIGRRRGFLELEKLHRRNWRNGNFKSFDDLPFPRYVKLSNRGLVFEDLYDNREHWLICTWRKEDHPDRVFLFNITSKPRLIAEKKCELGRNDVARIFPSGLVVLVNSDRGSYAVFEIVRTAEDFELRFKYRLGERSEPSPGDYAPVRDLDSMTMEESIWQMKITGTEENHVLVAMKGYESFKRLHVLNINSGTKIGTFAFAKRDAVVIIDEWTYPQVIVTSLRTLSMHIKLFDVLTGKFTPVGRFIVEGSMELYPGKRKTRIVGDYVLHESHDTFFLFEIEQSGGQGFWLMRIEKRSFENIFSDVAVFFDERKLVVCLIENDNFFLVRVFDIEGKSVAERRRFSAPRDLVAFIDRELYFCSHSFCGESFWKVFDLEGNALCSKLVANKRLDPVKVRRSSEIQPTRRITLFITEYGKSVRMYYL